MVLPTIPISFLRTVRIKERGRSTDLADTLDPNPNTSNSHITDFHRLLTNLSHFSKYQSRRLLSYHSKVNRHYRFLQPFSPTTILSFQSLPTNTDTHHKKFSITYILNCFSFR